MATICDVMDFCPSIKIKNEVFRALAIGLSKKAKCQDGYAINKFKFRTIEKPINHSFVDEEENYTKCFRVCARRLVYDVDPKHDYYGVLRDITELEYLQSNP